MESLPRKLSLTDRRTLPSLIGAVTRPLRPHALSSRHGHSSGLLDRHTFTIDYTTRSPRLPGRSPVAVLVDVLDLPNAEPCQAFGMASLETRVRQDAARIEAALDGQAEVHHMGGSRFAFIVELPTRDAVERLVEALHLRLTQPREGAAQPLRPLVHVGLCQAETGKDSADDIIRGMFVGLHWAVSSQVTYCWYSAPRDESLRREYHLLAGARDGLRHDEFHLLYQPRFRGSDLSAVSAEALIRWDHPRLGPVSPAEFIPVFERNALMEKVTEWVVDRALEQLSCWRRDGITLGLSINLSARNVARAGMADALVARIHAEGLRCSDLEIEITEGEWLRVNSVPGEQLRRMASAGIRLALDDFGSGYSNFAYLTELPIHTLKLDKSLIDGISTDTRARLKVRAIIGLAHDLGYTAVAEGAETADQVTTLRELGCDQIQGFALCRPISATELTDRLTVAPHLLE